MVRCVCCALPCVIAAHRWPPGIPPLTSPARLCAQERLYGHNVPLLNAMEFAKSRTDLLISASGSNRGDRGRMDVGRQRRT